MGVLKERQDLRDNLRSFVGMVQSQCRTQSLEKREHRGRFLRLQERFEAHAIRLVPSLSESKDATS